MSTLTMLATLALSTSPALAGPGGGQEHGCHLLGCGGGIDIGIDLGGGDVEVDLGDCLGVDVELGASCGVAVGLEAALACDPLAVEAACIAELGEDCGFEAFADCTALLVAHCEAELLAGGALFCDGAFIGADTCLGALDVDVDIDLEGALDVDLDADLDLDLGLCLDLGLGIGQGCEVAYEGECVSACDPNAVAQYCEEELGEDASLHAFAGCQSQAIEKCLAECEDGGASFCDGAYVGADLCIDLGIDLEIDL